MVAAIKRKGYAGAPYKTANDFVRDVAASCINNPKIITRKAGKTTVLASLTDACFPRQLEYLMNITRYIARNPDRKFPYGTTGCEAVHGHIVSCLRGITQMTSRYADVFADVFTICKLLSGVLLRLDLHRAFTQAELLKVVGNS